MRWQARSTEHPDFQEAIPARKRLGPAAPAQEEIWLSCALEREAPLFAVSTVLVLRGNLNLSLLEQAIDQLIARHEILRTTYHPGIQGLMQKVGSRQDVKIALCDLSRLDVATRKAVGAAAHKEEAQRSFDLRNGPILRARLIKQSSADFSLIFTIHHIAIDGWSMGVFARDLGRIYCAYRRGETPTLPEIRLRYIDFALLQKERLAERLAQGSLDEIRESFRLSPLTFSIEKECSGSAYWEGEHVRLRFPQPLNDQVVIFSRQMKVTPFIIFTAVVWIVLYAYSRRARFAMAADYANRGEPESESVIGLFVRQILLKGAVDSDATFIEVMRVAQRELHQALSYAECSISSLLPGSSDLRTAPPFRVKLAFQPPIDPPDFADVDVVAVDVLAEWAKFDLLFSVRMDANLASWELQYRKAMFDKSNMVAMLEDVERLTHLALQRPESSVAGLMAEMIAAREGNGRDALAQIKNRARAVLKESADPQTPLIECGPLTGIFADRISPWAIRASVRGVSLRHWISTQKQLIEESLQTHGAVLFRDFHVSSPEFQTISAELMGDLMNYVEGATPREKKSAQTYSSTLFPQDQQIELHNELSSAMTFPSRIAFYCVKPADSGGETPLADVHQVYTHVPEQVREPFAKKGWMLVRNFHKGFGLSWQQAFETQDKSVVEEHCRNNDIECAWQADGNLRLRQIRSAIMIHPVARLPVWFNHIAFWHESSLEGGLRAMLLNEFGKEGLPFNTYYGDASPIPTETIDVIRSAYRQAYTSFTWQRNDLLYLDNIGTAHGRTAYTGARELSVSMGRPYRREKFQ